MISCASWRLFCVSVLLPVVLLVVWNLRFGFGLGCLLLVLYWFPGGLWFYSLFLGWSLFDFPALFSVYCFPLQVFCSFVWAVHSGLGFAVTWVCLFLWWVLHSFFLSSVFWLIKALFFFFCSSRSYCSLLISPLCSVIFLFQFVFFPLALRCLFVFFPLFSLL